MIRNICTIIILLFASSPLEAASDLNADFPVSQQPGLQANPAMAHDSLNDRFFVVWSDFRNKREKGLDVYGRIMDATGRSIGGDITISSVGKGQGFASVAFDSNSERYLVVWTDWRNAASVDSDIYGQIINADGTLFGKEFVISAIRRASQKFPAVAFDPFHRRFLIVWSDDREQNIGKVYGRLVGPEGKPIGKEFRVTGGGGIQDGTSLVFDVKRKRFLVVWRGTEIGRTAENRGNTIYGALINPEAGPLGPPFRIAYEKEGSLPPSLYAASYSPQDDLFLVTWTSRHTFGDKGLDVYGVFLRPEDGELDRPAFPISATVDDQEAASVAFDSNRSRFLVVWYDLRRENTVESMDIYGRYIYPNAPISDELLISDSQASGIRKYPVLSFSRKSGEFLVLWEDGRVGGMTSRRIYGNVQ